MCSCLSGEAGTAVAALSFEPLASSGCTKIPATLHCLLHLRAVLFDIGLARRHQALADPVRWTDEGGLVLGCGDQGSSWGSSNLSSQPAAYLTGYTYLGLSYRPNHAAAKPGAGQQTSVESHVRKSFGSKDCEEVQGTSARQ